MINKETVINIKNLTFKYDETESIIDNLNLEICKGEKVAIVGANGAGKSTILRLITGLLESVEGTISVLNEGVNHKNMKSIRNNIGYTFQDPDNQLFMPSVFEDVAFSLRQDHIDEASIIKSVNEVLTEVGGTHLIDKASYKMSGGEKRIITLATALISKPKILILDEPSVGLDPKSRRQFIELLTERSETMIVTTHDMDLALDLCDRVIVLNNGCIKGDDTPLNIFSNHDLINDNNLELPLAMQGCPVCKNN